EGQAVDIEEALKRAQEELALLAEEEFRRRKIVATATYDAYDVDPFTRQYAGANGLSERRPVADPCSDKQAGFICFLARQCGEKWTFQAAKQLSRRQASGVIDKLKKRVGV